MTLVPDERANRPEPERVLSMEQTMQLRELKDLGADFVALCQKIGKSRELSLAITNAQQAVFWGCAHITGLDT